MSTRPPSAEPTDLRPLAGLLWAIGGALIAIAVALLDGAALGMLTLGIWCLVTAWRMGVRG